ncbi:MAG: DUF6587 family protein [Leptothrix sp. (in: b-proteobacteria)]
MITLYGTFEFTVLAGALGWAAYQTLTRVLPLRRVLGATVQQLGRTTRLPVLQRLGDRWTPPATAGGCGSCGSCSSGCGSTRTHTLAPLNQRPVISDRELGRRHPM